MFGRFIRALIFICLLAAVFWLVPWVLANIGIMIPSMIVHIFGIVLVLVAILVLYQLLWEDIRGYNWWGRSPPP